MTLIYISAAWIAGIYLGSRIALPWALICIGLIPFCIIPFLPQQRKHLLVAGFCLLSLFGGCLRLQSSLPTANEQHLQFYNDKGTARIVGSVQTEPETGNTTSILQLSAREIQMQGTEEQISGKALIRVPRYSEYHYGDILRITGRLETPTQFADFDYKNYLAGQGIYSVINYPKIEVLDTGKGFRPLAWIYSLRNYLGRSLSRSLPEPQASLAQGILLGLRGDIPDSLNQALSRTGTSHILAISGLNISIVIGMVSAAGIWLFGRKYSIYIWLALLVIWLYTLLTGMKPPVIRGVIMGSIFLLAEYLGRQRSALTALAFAAAIMVGIEPQVLWDASFQLSFLSMAGLVFISPYFQVLGRKAVLAAAGKEGKGSAIIQLCRRQLCSNSGCNSGYLANHSLLFWCCLFRWLTGHLLHTAGYAWHDHYLSIGCQCWNICPVIGSNSRLGSLVVPQLLCFRSSRLRCVAILIRQFDQPPNLADSHLLCSTGHDHSSLQLSKTTARLFPLDSF